jgi:hypothetical protein
MIPEHDNPLTLAYLAGVKAKTHAEMMAAMKLAKALEKGKTETQIAACHLAAEFLLERR